MLASGREQVMSTLDMLLTNADSTSPDPTRSDPRLVLRAFIRRYVEAFAD
jgi:hypothetical protein